jgi:chromosome segregation protein
MYLSKLDIVGFKSFAQKTEFKFNDGLTAIVGPNGCGKTNIVDAIRWVLGEQKTTVLRSELMENVIFNGSANRKSLGMAEVSLTMNNNKGILPTDYSEVVVTRRLFRDGESQYLLNNTQCRLRDIVDLFMDTGMGADSYSVIELKMVEAILSGKPEERRHLLEEAAGVNKYKIRKKEASRKLMNVQTDLVRIADLVQEIEKQVNALSRQAAKTRKYNKLMEQLRELELNLLKREYLKFSGDIESILKEIEELNQKRVSLDNENQAAETNIKLLEEKLIELDGKNKEIQSKDEKQRNLISSKSKDIAVNNEKIISLINTQTRNQKEIDETLLLINRFEQNSTENLKNIELSAENKEKLIEQLSQQNDIVKEAKDSLIDLRNDSQSINEEILNYQNQLKNFRDLLVKNNIKRRNNEEKLDKLNDELSKINLEINIQHEEISKAESKKELLQENINLAHTKLNSAQEKQKSLNSEIEKQNQVINQHRSSLSSKKATLDFLSSLMDVDDTSKFILKNEAWKNIDKPIVLIEDIDTEDDYRVAVESALGDYAHIFIIDDESQAHSAFEYLKKNEKGKVSFICKSNIKEASEPKVLNKSEKVIGWISELVKVDDKLRAMLRNVLFGTLLVEDFQTARKVVFEGLATTAVTLKGEIIRNDGFIKGGGVSKKEGLSVGKNERIIKIKKEIETLESEIKEIDESLKAMKSELAEINIFNLNNDLRKAETESSKNLQMISQFNYKIDSLSRNHEMIEQNLIRITEESSEMDREIDSYNSDIESLESQLKIKKEEFSVFQNQLSESERNLANQEKISKEIEMNVIKLNAEINSLTNENERLANQKKEADLKIILLNKEITDNLQQIKLLQESVEELNTELEILNKEALLIQNEKDFTSNEITSIEQQIHQYTNDLSALRKSFDKIIESIHTKEITLTELNSNIKSYIDRAHENYNIDLSQFVIIEDESFNYNETKAALNSLKERLSSLGNVNFMALEEFEEAQQRFDFYQKQLADLIESEKLLLETIEEIDKNALERFNNTFILVQENFKMLFTKLFGTEGYAELKLSNSNALESDIEIIARPPGKKPHSIEMLSGGEKTLTAISLLFAIYLVKPSPFCILDEVDAPLDDANIDKFLNLIREFSINTQFLIVSHNKRTMELSDTLYGITMAEEGVSKVVSVKLSQEKIGI